MIEKNEITDELREISIVVASIKKTNVFKVPDNYFENLAEKITVHTLLNGEEKVSAETLKVPEGYFDNLSEQVLAKIKKEESNTSGEFAVLSSLKDKNVFTVPEGYFENLSETILTKVNQPEAKVIPISRAKSWWKYAAAAVVTGAIAVSSLQIFYKSPDMVKDNSVVTEQSGLPDYIESSFQYKTPQQVDEGIASLSDDEIANYLESSGNLMDVETLSSDVNTSDLPSEMDYLSNDNTLNNYLNSLNASGANK